MTTCTKCVFTGAADCARCVRSQGSYVARFEREHSDAQDEFMRLSELFKDVCWYNFETECRVWGHPWRQSKPDSFVELHAHRYSKFWNRGHLCETAKYPYYYQGAVNDAPRLPPQIVLNELREAEAYVKACSEQISAPCDWSPGGAKYEALRRTTMVGANFSSGLTG